MGEKIKKQLFTTISEGENRLLGFGLLIGSMIAFLFCISQGLGSDIWYDEIFSVKFAQMSYGDIVTATARDVHPPFYYWYLKFVQDTLGLFFTDVHSFVLCKVASMIPFVFIYIYALTYVRKRFGIKTAGTFLFLVILMPQISNYIVEIRMYALALFFITAMFLHSIEIVYENGTRDFVLFFVYGIITAYTQYYACIAVVGLYICLFVYFLIEKKTKGIRNLFISAGASVVCYLPWMPAFISQVTAVNNNYWIQPLTFRSIFGCMKFVFLPVSYDSRNFLYALLMIAIGGVTFIYYVWKHHSDRKNLYIVITGIFVPVFIAFMGFVCSAVGRPIFVYRYLIPGLGAMWLVYSILISKQFSSRLSVLVLIPFLLAGYSNMQGYYAEEHKKIVEMEKTQMFLDAIPQDAVIVANFNHVQAIAAAYLDNEILLYGEEPEVLIQEFYDNCGSVDYIEDSDELVSLIKEEDVYFFGSFIARDEILEKWNAAGISHTEDGSYLLERYWFNVYHCSVGNN